jgi:hypothetical protein
MLIVLAPDFMTKICKKAAQHFHRAVSKVFDRMKSVTWRGLHTYWFMTPLVSIWCSNFRFSEIGATVLDVSYLFLRDGIAYFRYKVGFRKSSPNWIKFVMDRRRTFEDFFDMKNNDLQLYLRDASTWELTCTVSMVITKSLILVTNDSLSTQHQDWQIIKFYVKYTIYMTLQQIYFNSGIF